MMWIAGAAENTILYKTIYNKDGDKRGLQKKATDLRTTTSDKLEALMAIHIIIMPVSVSKAKHRLATQFTGYGQWGDTTCKPTNGTEDDGDSSAAVWHSRFRFWSAKYLLSIMVVTTVAI